MQNDTLQCPLCYSPVQIVGDGCGFVAKCSGSCLSSLLGVKASIPLALEEFQRFLKELELGAEMWGSKIKDGVAED